MDLGSKAPGRGVTAAWSKASASSAPEEATGYREILLNPQPADRWIKARHETPIVFNTDGEIGVGTSACQAP